MQKNSLVRDLVGDTVAAEESILPIRIHLETVIEDIDGESVATTTVVVRPKKPADDQKKVRPLSCRIPFSVKGSAVKRLLESQCESAYELPNVAKEWANECTSIKRWLESYAMAEFSKMVENAKKENKAFSKPVSVFTDDVVKLFEAYDEWVVIDENGRTTKSVLKDTEVVKKMQRMAVLEATRKLVNHLYLGWWGNQPIYRKIKYSNPQKAAQ